MQIVINISEKRYKNIKEQVDKRDYPDMQIGRAIADGVLIPECHGRLGDLDYLYKKFVANKCHDDLVLKFIKEEPTIIKANTNS